MTGREIQALVFFLKSFAFDECCVNISKKQLADIYHIPVGHVKRLRFMARKRAKADPPRMGRPPIRPEDQEHELVQVILEPVTNGKCLRRGEVLDEVERRDGKALTYGRIKAFLARDSTQIIDVTIYPQERLHLQIPRLFLDDYIEWMRQDIIGMNPRLVENIDEIGWSDWEDRKRYRGIVPAELASEPVHIGVTRKIKLQTMLVCINAPERFSALSS
jgi:hypothetical protein